MTPSQVAFTLPPLVAEPTQPDSLESLRSPQLDNVLNDRSLARESVAVSEFNDIALDDESLHSATFADQTEIQDNESVPPHRGASSTTPTNEIISAHHSMGHKKTVSTTTIRSFHEPGVSLLMNRLDLQDEHGGRARGSVDGQLKLQEEFARLQEKEAKEHTVEGAIDWGQSACTSHRVWG